MTLKVTGADGSGTGSGWVYDGAGHIVTNNHVVAGAADGGKITVVLADGQQVDGTVVGRDGSYDLAVVKVDRTDLAPLTLGASADVVVGDEVIAVGAPLGLDSTVTAGIVSALNRPVTPGDADDQSYINAIQTDAAINPGNSGGPLLDMQGQVIGVNSAIATAPGSSTSAQSGNIGVGFAIPSDQVRTTVTQLIQTGKAVHPVIGVYLDPELHRRGRAHRRRGPQRRAGGQPRRPRRPSRAQGRRRRHRLRRQARLRGRRPRRRHPGAHGRRQGHSHHPSQRERAGCHDGPRRFGGVTTRRAVWSTRGR